MRSITRHEMEKRLNQSRVINSTMEQDTREIRIVLELESRESCMVRYDLENRTKDYLVAENL